MQAASSPWAALSTSAPPNSPCTAPAQRSPAFRSRLEIRLTLGPPDCELTFVSQWPLSFAVRAEFCVRVCISAPGTDRTLLGGSPGTGASLSAQSTSNAVHAQLCPLSQHAPVAKPRALLTSPRPVIHSPHCSLSGLLNNKSDHLLPLS